MGLTAPAYLTNALVFVKFLFLLLSHSTTRHTDRQQRQITQIDNTNIIIIADKTDDTDLPPVTFCST